MLRSLKASRCARASHRNHPIRRAASRESWTHDIGSGFGSVAAGIATYMIPGIGPSLAGGMFIPGCGNRRAARGTKPFN